MKTLAILFLFASSPAFAAKPFVQPRAPGMIYGHCTVLAGGGDSLPHACPAVTLMLRTESGDVVARAATDERGNFFFKADNNKKYVISVGSERFEIVSPKDGWAVGGDVLDLKLKVRGE